jgi:hypothetical protein
VDEDADWLADYRDLPWAQVRDRAEAAGHPVRVLRPGTAMTMDYRPDRLNIHLDERDDVVGLSAG